MYNLELIRFGKVEYSETGSLSYLTKKIEWLKRLDKKLENYFIKLEKIAWH